VPLGDDVKFWPGDTSPLPGIGMASVDAIVGSHMLKHLPSVPMHACTCVRTARLGTGVIAFTSVVAGSDSLALDHMAQYLAVYSRLGHVHGVQDYETHITDACGDLVLVRVVSALRSQTPWYHVQLLDAIAPLHLTPLYAAMAEGDRNNPALAEVSLPVQLMGGTGERLPFNLAHNVKETSFEDPAVYEIEVDASVTTLPLEQRGYVGSAGGSSHRCRVHAKGDGTRRLDGALAGVKPEDRKDHIQRFTVFDMKDADPRLFVGLEEGTGGARGSVPYASLNLVLRVAEAKALRAAHEGKLTTNGDHNYSFGHGVYSPDACKKGGEEGGGEFD
jgi:hypothetical protein